MSKAKPLSDIEDMNNTSANIDGGNLFCFGFGYSCRHLAQNLKNQGNWTIAGTTRSSEKKKKMRAMGVKTYNFNTDTPLADPELFLHDVTHLIISTPPDDNGDPVFNLHGKAITELPNLQWVGYLSSTSVYGDKEGDWVDETALTEPQSQRGSRREKAEKQWLSLYRHEGLPVHIFRLAGIYGPSRSVLDSLNAGLGRRVDKPGHVFNRIHVDDIVQVLQASFTNPNPGRVYNVCDDTPSPSHEVVSFAADLLNTAPPPLVPIEKAHLPPMALSFYEDNKRLRNTRIKEELGITLLHPDYKSGLKACLESDQSENKEKINPKDMDVIES